MRKEVKEKDLVSGQVYYDTSSYLGIPMEFVRIDAKGTHFKQIKEILYQPNTEGLVCFTTETIWYLPNEGEPGAEEIK